MHDSSAHHRYHDFRVTNACFWSGQNVIGEDYKIGDFAGLDRSFDAFVKHKTRIVDRRELDGFLPRDALIGPPRRR